MRLRAGRVGGVLVLLSLSLVLLLLFDGEVMDTLLWWPDGG
jgi:hypothetical protein